MRLSVSFSIRWPPKPTMPSSEIIDCIFGVGRSYGIYNNVQIVWILGGNLIHSVAYVALGSVANP